MSKISASAGDDEPYSPGGSDSGSLERSNSPSVKQTTSDDLHKKMEELTRKIEEEKKQIENIAVTISGDSLVCYYQFLFISIYLYNIELHNFHYRTNHTRPHVRCLRHRWKIL